MYILHIPYIDLVSSIYNYDSYIFLDDGVKHTKKTYSDIGPVECSQSHQDMPSQPAQCTFNHPARSMLFQPSFKSMLIQPSLGSMLSPPQSLRPMLI